MAPWLSQLPCSIFTTKKVSYNAKICCAYASACWASDVWRHFGAGGGRGVSYAGAVCESGESYGAAGDVGEFGCDELLLHRR